MLWRCLQSARLDHDDDDDHDDDNDDDNDAAAADDDETVFIFRLENTSSDLCGDFE